MDSADLEKMVGSLMSTPETPPPMSRIKSSDLGQVESWNPVARALPDCSGIFWVIIKGYPELSYFDGSHFCNTETEGDREGLSSERLTGVTHWCDVIPPEFRSELLGVDVDFDS